MWAYIPLGSLNARTEGKFYFVASIIFREGLLNWLWLKSCQIYGYGLPIMMKLDVWKEITTYSAIVKQLFISILAYKIVNTKIQYLNSPHWFLNFIKEAQMRIDWCIHMHLIRLGASSRGVGVACNSRLLWVGDIVRSGTRHVRSSTNPCNFLEIFFLQIAIKQCKQIVDRLKGQ